MMIFINRLLQMKAEIRYSHKAEKTSFFPSNVGLGSFYSLCKPWAFFSFSLRMYCVFLLPAILLPPKTLKHSLKLSAQNDFWADFSAQFLLQRVLVLSYRVLEIILSYCMTMWYSTKPYVVSSLRELGVHCWLNIDMDKCVCMCVCVCMYIHAPLLSLCTWI